MRGHWMLMVLPIALGLLATEAQARAIKIQMKKGLDFGEAVPGDPSKTIAPSQAESAQLTVTGDNNTGYTISLPAGNVTLTTLKLGAVMTMSLSTFKSIPVTGALNGSGIQDVFVGATRAGLPLGQAGGDYSGTFSVTVVY